MLFIALTMTMAGCSSAGLDESSSTTISMSWDAPTTYIDGSGLDPANGIKEYRIYYRTETGTYSAEGYYPVSAPTTSVSVNLPISPGTYYFVVTAVDQTDMESYFSNEVSKTFN